MSSDNLDRIIDDLQAALDDWHDQDMGFSNEPQWLRDLIDQEERMRGCVRS
jgi:hypothetical protein